MTNTNVKQTSDESNTTIAVKDLSWSKGWDQVPHSMTNKIKAEIMYVCGWGTLATFHNKRRMDVPISQAEFDAVKKILAAIGIDASTGNRI